MTKRTQTDTQTGGQTAKRPYTKPVLIEIDFNATEGKANFFLAEAVTTPATGPS